jgi:hypothetical protein
VQLAVAGSVPFAPIVMKSLEKGRKTVEEFQTRDIRFLDLLLLSWHAVDYAHCQQRAQL